MGRSAALCTISIYTKTISISISMSNTNAMFVVPLITSDTAVGGHKSVINLIKLASSVDYNLKLFHISVHCTVEHCVIPLTA